MDRIDRLAFADHAEVCMLHSPIRRNIEETGGKSSYASRPSVMVCLSPSPTTKRVIRAAARMAFPVPLSSPSSAASASPAAGTAPIALYVGSTGREAEENSLLRENIQYARDYGFEVHTIQSTDIPLAIAEYARREKVTDLFLGYSPPSFTLLPKPAINEKLLSALPTVDIHIVPDPVSSSYPKDMRQIRPGSPNWNLRDLLLVLAVMAVATFLSCWFYISRFSNSNIITIYILGVLIASVMTSSRVYGTFAAILYVLLFNFLFIEPRFTLLVYDSAYMMTYLVTMVAALITGTDPPKTPIRQRYFWILPTSWRARRIQRTLSGPPVFSWCTCSTVQLYSILLPLLWDTIKAIPVILLPGILRRSAPGTRMHPPSRLKTGTVLMIQMIQII